ncbi:MAG: HdeA family protein [Xanthobacteraceae bacterium]|nr:HdeA family protein [Xanthobacteraceae bacterium]
MKAIPTLSCGFALVTGAAAPAGAQMIIDVSKVTCEQFLTASPNAVEVGIWLSGYYNGLRKNTQLDLNQFKKNADAVVAECRADPKKTVMQAVEKLPQQ